MSIRIKGTSYQAEVGSDGSLQTTGAPIESNAGFMNVSAQNDDGVITGTKYNAAIEVSDDYQLNVGTTAFLWNETFVGTAFNTGLWSQLLTTMTSTVASGFANLNAGASTTTATSAQIRTYRHFPILKQSTLRAEMEVQFSQLPQTNNVCEWGLFLASGSSAPTDGAFFRLNATGQFYCVANYNGTEIQSSALNFSTLIGANNTHTFLIYAGSTGITFWIDNILAAEISNPAGNGSATASNNLPLAFRVYNSGAVTTAQIMKVGMTSIVIDGAAINKPWGQQVASWGGHLSQLPTGSASYGQTAISPNAALTATAVPTNTTAAAGQVGLGGETLITATFAINTPVIVFSYLNPLGTAALPGRTMHITGATIQSSVAVACTSAATGTNFTWALAYGHNALSLATGESATTKAPRKLMMGNEGMIFATGGVLGASMQRFQDDFTVCPLVVQPGEYIQVVCTNRGAVLTAGSLLTVASITGYWE